MLHRIYINAFNASNELPRIAVRASWQRGRGHVRVSESRFKRFKYVPRRFHCQFHITTANTTLIRGETGSENRPLLNCTKPMSHPITQACTRSLKHAQPTFFVMGNKVWSSENLSTINSGMTQCHIGRTSGLNPTSQFLAQ